MIEQWEAFKNTHKEETHVEYEGNTEFDTKTLKSDTFGLEEHIKELEKEGWNVFTRGSDFVVLERTREKGKKEALH